MVQFECVYGNKRDFNQYVQIHKAKNVLVVDWTQVKNKLRKNDVYDLAPSDDVISVTIASILTLSFQSKNPPSRIIYLIQNFEPTVIENLKRFVNSKIDCWFKLIYFYEIDLTSMSQFDEVEFIKL